MQSGNLLFWGLDLLSRLFLFVIICVIIAIMYITDKIQTKLAIRHNYPIIGWFRYRFEKQGEFIRQYFFSQDREGILFNRAERSLAFGSTRSLDPIGTIMSMNCAFPTLTELFDEIRRHQKRLDNLSTLAVIPPN